MPAPQTAEKFYVYFNAERKAIEDQIAQVADDKSGSVGTKDATDSCLAGISRLSGEVKDAADFLPPYDQRSYSQAIKSLSEALKVAREGSAPRQKFSFKARLKPNASHPVSRGESRGVTSHEPPAAVQPNVPAPDHATAIENVSNTSVALPPSASDKASSARLSAISGSLVNITNHGRAGRRRFANLYVRDATSSLILGGHVDGPVHLTNVTSSVIVVACRQFRMHQAKDCVIYLLCNSVPMIEHCSNVSFAPMPLILCADEDIVSDNKWDKVNDFNWLRSEPSPNWGTVSEADRIDGAVWISIAEAPIPIDHGLDSILRSVGVRL